MSLRSRFAVGPKTMLGCRSLGFCLFVAAFFLPACRDMALEAGAANTFTGWECAQAALVISAEMETYQSPFLLAAVGGWVNPILPLYLAATFAPRLRAIRRAVAIAIPLCVVAVWIFFAIVDLVPMIGHYLWVAGIFLTLLPEVLLAVKAPGTGNAPQALTP